MFISIQTLGWEGEEGPGPLRLCYKGPGMIKTGFGRATPKLQRTRGTGVCKYRFMWVGCSCRRRVPCPDR